jgi:hypothetical protein
MVIAYEKRKEYFREYRRKNAEKNKEACAKYAESNPDKEQLRKRAWRLRNIDTVLARQAAENARAGHKPRKSKSETVAVRVPKKRRFVIIGNRAYFNRETGYDIADLTEVIRDMKQAAIKTGSKKPPNS